MLAKFKRFFYFPIAFYFRFFASIQLSLWRPKIIVVTGSSGKTTLLHLIESQLKDKARYSHHANSAFGIPFDILGLSRKNLLLYEWILLFLKSPFKAFKKPFNEKLYIVEADSDRPGEAKFLSSFLKPSVTLWTGVSRTHSVNFDKLKSEKFSKVEEAIAYEFGYFLEFTKDLAIVNGDLSLVKSQLNRTKAKIEEIKKDQLQKYEVDKDSTEFKIDGQDYKIKALLPEENFYSLAMTISLLKFLDLEIDSTFSLFKLPPGRSSVFKGIKNTTLIDSTYNATLEGMNAILNMFDKYKAQDKWVVLGDMIELGEEEQEEHEKLADIVSSIKLSKIILMGPRVSKYTYPKLKSSCASIEKFTTPKETLDYLNTSIKGGETILFKGARFLEGVIEHLLENKSDVKKLCRREKIWQIRREKWGL